MSVNKLRFLLLSCCWVPLIITFIFGESWISLISTMAGGLLAITLLYFNLSKLVNLPEEHSKLKPIRHVTWLNVLILGICFIMVILQEKNRLNQQSIEIFLVVLLLSILLVFGNIAPKLPFNRYTGLRLPWTIRDEDTWIIAHRILGYISIPLAIIFLT